MFGVGGTLSEFIEDVTFARVPVSNQAAARAIEGLRNEALLQGPRGANPVDRAHLAELIQRMSALLVANPEISEVDLNPIINTGNGLVVVDAVIVTS
jgi:acetyltransferase